MPLLRLFGRVAEAAGTSSDEIPGGTLDEVLDAASARYGPGFAEVAKGCRVWVNGADRDLGANLGEGDEVALLPPVSGG